MEITLVYNDPKQIECIEVNKYPHTFKFVDSVSKKSKKEAWRVKSYYGAKLDPFALVMDGIRPIKAFYTEAEDVIDSLIKYLDNYESTSN